MLQMKLLCYTHLYISSIKHNLKSTDNKLTSGRCTVFTYNNYIQLDGHDFFKICHLYLSDIAIEIIDGSCSSWTVDKMTIFDAAPYLEDSYLYDMRFSQR
jgi:hypothetical protein